MLIGTSRFRRFIQQTEYTCVPVCVQMVLYHFTGKKFPLSKLKQELGTDEDGTSFSKATKVLRKCGYRVGNLPKMRLSQVASALERGAVVMASVDGDHVLLVHGADTTHLHVADPSVVRTPKRSVTHAAFKRRFDREGLVIYP